MTVALLAPELVRTWAVACDAAASRSTLNLRRELTGLPSASSAMTKMTFLPECSPSADVSVAFRHVPAEQGDELNKVLTSRPLRTALRVPELRLADMLSAMVRISLPVVDPEATDMRTVGLVTGVVDCAQRASGRAMT